MIGVDLLQNILRALIAHLIHIAAINIKHADFPEFETFILFILLHCGQRRVGAILFFARIRSGAYGLGIVKTVRTRMNVISPWASSKS